MNMPLNGKRAVETWCADVGKSWALQVAIEWARYVVKLYDDQGWGSLWPYEAISLMGAIDNGLIGESHHGLDEVLRRHVWTHIREPSRTAIMAIRGVGFACLDARIPEAYSETIPSLGVYFSENRQFRIHHRMGTRDTTVKCRTVHGEFDDFMIVDNDVNAFDILFVRMPSRDVTVEVTRNSDWRNLLAGAAENVAKVAGWGAVDLLESAMRIRRDAHAKWEIDMVYEVSDASTVPWRIYADALEEGGSERDADTIRNYIRMVTDWEDCRKPCGPYHDTRVMEDIRFKAAIGWGLGDTRGPRSIITGSS